MQVAVAQVSTGTGFAVVSGLLVTNHHVIEGCSSIEVKTENGRHKSVVVDADQQSDLALLRVPTLVGLSAKIRSPAVVNLGEPVMVFGFPLAGALTSSGNFTSGLVSGLRGLGESEGVFQITAPVQLGNSGGPVLDASGQVIGVVTSKLNAVKTAVATGDIPQNINFAVTPEALNDFLIKNKVPVDYFSSKKSLNTASIAKLAQSFTYQIECMGKSQQAKETPKTTPKVSPPRESKTFKDCAACPEMVVVPAGSFMMGSPSDPDPLVTSATHLERPQHRVNIKSFAIGKYEITQEQWLDVMGYSPSKFIGRQYPVESVSWNDAQLFVQKLSQKTGKNYRLPSEAEWEYAARGGSTTTYPWGNDVGKADEYAWFKKNYSKINGINQVGLKKPNQFDLYDMIGNVSEWTADCGNTDFYGAPDDGSAWLTGNRKDEDNGCGPQRILRGAFYLDEDLNLRSTKRYLEFKAFRFMTIGFRVAMDISLDASTSSQSQAKPGKASDAFATDEYFFEIPTDPKKLLFHGIGDDFLKLTQGKSLTTWKTLIDPELKPRHYNFNISNLKFNITKETVYFWIFIVYWDNYLEKKLRIYVPPRVIELDCQNDRQRLVGEFTELKYSNDNLVVDGNSLWDKVDGRLKINLCPELRLKQKEYLNYQNNLKNK